MIYDNIIMVSVVNQNIGDVYASPFNYFDFDKLNVKLVNLLKPKQIEKYIGNRKNLFIIGGGGLLHRQQIWDNLFRNIIKHNDTIVWGPGLNTRFRSEITVKEASKLICLEKGEKWTMKKMNQVTKNDLQKYTKSDMIRKEANGVIYSNVDKLIKKNFKGRYYFKTNMDFYFRDTLLYGIRDDVSKTYLLPCVSCMHPLLSKMYTVKRKFLIYEHHRYPMTISGIDEKLNIKRISNSNNNKEQIENENNDKYIDELHSKQFVEKNYGKVMTDVIVAMGESDVIMSNSYHGLYWGILLNKKVIYFVNHKNRSLKYSLMEYNIPKYTGNIIKDSKKCVRYPNALTEAKQYNKKFYQKVLGIISDDTGNNNEIKNNKRELIDIISKELVDNVIKDAINTVIKEQEHNQTIDI